MNHGETDHPAINDRAELVVTHIGRNDQANIKTGAAHVARHDIRVAKLPRDVSRADQSSHRTSVIGPAGRSLVDFGDAARVLHHHERAGIAILAQFVPHG